MAMKSRLQMEKTEDCTFTRLCSLWYDIHHRSLKATMKTERLNYTIALSTPTIRQTLRVFNLSLTRLTMTVWQEIKNQVLKEYIA